MAEKWKGRVLFDLLGGIVVVAWLGALLYYGFGSQVSGPAPNPVQGGPALLQEGETWMLIFNQDAAEVGYTHEVRTPVKDGWLFEYDVFAAMTFGGAQLVLDSDVKAILDAEQYLLRANAKLTSPAGEMEVIAIVRGTEVELIVDAGAGPTTSVVDLGTRPQLGNQVLARLLASDDLKVGATYEDVYFDPMAMKQKPMKLVYVGLKELKLVGSVAMCHHVRQRLEDGTELDVYIDENGELCTQEFPMKMVASRMGTEFGAIRSRQLRRKALAASKESKLGELPLAEVISIAQGFARGINKEARPRLRIVGAGDPKDLHLVATNYRVIEANADHILVEIGSQPVVHWKKREDDVERDSVVDPPSAEFVQSLGAKIDAALIAKHNSGLQGGNRSEEWSAALVEELSQGLSRIARGVRFKDGKTEEAVWVQVDFGDGVVDFHPPSMQGGNWLQLSTKKAFPVFSDVKVFEESSGEE